MTPNLSGLIERLRAARWDFNGELCNEAADTLASLSTEPMAQEGGEVVLITPHMLNAGTDQITRPTMDADDKKDLAVKVFRAMIAARNSSPTSPSEEVTDAVDAALERAANAVYVACAQTRHVRLGDDCAAAVRALQTRSKQL